MKKALVYLSTEFTHLVNVSLSTSIFPTDWASGTIKPKEGGCTLVSNWRPVGILPLPGKIMDKFVHAQLVNYFEDKKIFSRSQFGFRKNNSTVSGTFHLVSTLLENYNANRISSSIFVDYGKAFDTIDHNVLAHKLSLYGCSKRIVDWYVDYFRNRQQRTSVNGMVSESLPVPCGVP